MQKTAFEWSQYIKLQAELTAEKFNPVQMP